MRATIRRLEKEGRLLHVREPVSKTYEIAGILKKLEPRPVLFEQVLESPFRVAGNLFCGKGAFADYFGMAPAEIIPRMLEAIAHPSDPTIAGQGVQSSHVGVQSSHVGVQSSHVGPYGEAPCQEVVELEPDLERLPILRHCELDGGNYLSSGVFVARHPTWGQNLDFHRGMQFSRNEMAVRVVQGRHFDRFLQDLSAVDVAVCVGLPPNVLAAAATSVELGVDELGIANALEPLQVVRGKTVDVLLPAEAEFVLEGTVYADRRHSEGPFVDLTETYDVVRQEPVFVVKAITHRHDAIWQALLPGALEHKLLMGMPREPTIFKKVNEVVKCLDVHVNPGGCSWLHAIVKIQKQSEDDGKKAIQAAFAGHGSCKHVFVVDEDIDIYDPLQVEWAMATRFQGDRDLVVLPRSRGSSLDPSSEPGTHLTSRLGFDLTRPLSGVGGKDYARAPFPDVDLSRYASLDA